MTEVDLAFPTAGDVISQTSKSRGMRRWVASVCALTFLAYLGTLRFGFVHDDRGQIVGNPAVHSWHAVPGYFTSHVWAAVAPAFLGNDYRPLFLLWLRINDSLFGLHASGWHFTSVLAHVTATFCVFLLAHKIIGEWPVALCGALIFGLHPVHIEAVAWISGVPEPLAGALMIAAYLCWVCSREAGGRRWFSVSLVLYTLALLTKETAIMLVPIIFASLWSGFPQPVFPQPHSRAQRAWQSLRVLVPFILLTLLYLGVRTLALKGFSHPAAKIRWLTVVLTWPSLLLFYLRLLLLPVGLSPFYGLEFVSHPTLANCALPAAAILAVAVGLWMWAARVRAVALMIPWLVFPLLPVLNVQVFGNGNFAHNRYLYLPSVGFAILVAMAVGRLKSGRLIFGIFPLSQALVMIALGISGCWLVWQESRYYTSDAAFYSYAYSSEANPDPVIAMDYANTLAEQGDYSRAATVYGKVIEAHPDMWNACFNLGHMYYQRGDLNSAVQYLSRAAAGDPAQAGAFFYLGLAKLKLQRLDDAEANLRRAVQLAPAAANYHFALGTVLRIRGKLSEALAEFSQELALDPRHEAAAQQIAEIRSQLAAR